METKQMTLATAGFAIKTKVTRRAQFLAEMDKVVPWSRLLAVIEPHYPVAEQGRPRPPLQRMLRIYFMQQWFNLSDPAMEDALYDSEAMRRFAGIDPGADVVPDESTILRFRHVLEERQLTERIFQEVRQLLEERKLLLKLGTIVDATIIAAPPSTKNASQSRDPEMKQVRKGNQWHFGMKIHVGTDRQGLVHSWRRVRRRKVTSRGSTSCCMAARLRSLAIRPTGRRSIDSIAVTRAFAIASIGVRGRAAR